MTSLISNTRKTTGRGKTILEIGVTWIMVDKEPFGILSLNANGLGDIKKCRSLIVWMKISQSWQ